LNSKFQPPNFSSGQAEVGLKLGLAILKSANLVLDRQNLSKQLEFVDAKSGNFLLKFRHLSVDQIVASDVNRRHRAGHDASTLGD
jgi:hypothetical protein